jgi:hypothetical protein
MQPVADRRWVTFMLSFSNYLPLPAAEVSRIGASVAAWPLGFDRLYGGWWGQVRCPCPQPEPGRLRESFLRAAGGVDWETQKQTIGTWNLVLRGGRGSCPSLTSNDG